MPKTIIHASPAKGAKRTRKQWQEAFDAGGLRGMKRNPRGDGEGHQNTSDAVMAQRGIDKQALDDFPTPPWATRALFNHVVRIDPLTETALEPAAGRGYMAEVMKTWFAKVETCDIKDYGYCRATRGGFLEAGFKQDSFDWVVTNPPFKLAREFALEALRVARRGVALLCRTVIIEGQARYNQLYLPHPPQVVAQFVERVPMVEGRVDPQASTATGYCWIVWDKLYKRRGQLYPSASSLVQAPLVWIPACRKRLEIPIDYVLPVER